SGKLLPRGGEEAFHRFITADVAGKEPFAAKAVLLHRLSHAAFALLAVLHRQKAEAALGAVLDAVAGDVRGDRSIVGDVEDQTFLSFQKRHRNLLLSDSRHSNLSGWAIKTLGVYSVFGCSVEVNLEAQMDANADKEARSKQIIFRRARVEEI